MSLFFFLNNNIIEGKEKILFIFRAVENFCFHISSKWGSVLRKLGYKDIAFFSMAFSDCFLKSRFLCFWYNLRLEHCFLYHKVLVRIL